MATLCPSVVPAAQAQDVPSTLHALWRGTDPTTSMTIQWLSESDSTRSVGLIRTSDGTSMTVIESDVVVFGEPGVVHRHRVDYTGLAPATRYEITLDGSATGLFIETAPATLDEKLTFVQGGDIAVGEEVIPLHKTAAAHDPLFALLGGDMADSEPPIEAGAPDWAEFFENWHDGMRTEDGRMIPMVAAIGNHEIDDGKATQYFRLLDNTHREEAYWAFDIGGYLTALVLDNELHAGDGGPDGKISGAQREWIDETLQARADVPHTFAVMHTPPYTAVKSRRQDRSRMTRKHWVPIFEKHKVDVVFQDDDELYARTYPLLGGKRDPDGVIYAGNGGWGEYDDRKIAGEMQGEEADDDEEMIDEKVEAALAQFEVAKETNYVLRVDLYPDGSQDFLAFNTEGTVDQYARAAERSGFEE